MTKAKMNYVENLNHSLQSSPMKEVLDCKIEISPLASNAQIKHFLEQNKMKRQIDEQFLSKSAISKE